MNRVINVDLGEQSYNIHIGKECLPSLAGLLAGVPRGSRSILVSDDIVFRLYGEQFYEILQSAGLKIEVAVLAGGESCKNLETLGWLYEQMISKGLDRQSTVFALGGGVVGDIAGFAAASFMRGIGYIQLPTSLLAQVDSSVGGKTGVNLSLGKNLVGAFYQPSLVFADVNLLNTLAEKEYQTGLAEVIKYGVIWDSKLFDYLETNIESIKARDMDCLIHIISRCCEIKAEIVAQDEKEKGLRALLNLGHTFGHAFEALTEYKKFTHGQAVAIGMVYATRLAAATDMINEQDAKRVTDLIKNYGLPLHYGDIRPSEIVARMHLDKKNTGGKITLVLPAAIGRSEIVGEIDPAQIEAILI
ncbi:3-dehydroquinate synthase AroB [Syntrophomonas zehnderi OL-4]|uniref:3-dehydroquinate synthase n=1 Tax=Syntrophomonas zehnderi OL-4 TaxID=690567 RepID=A0A0E4GC38_9FIRM|nr:3-dehydroquinate synthase [Syntrophomonas zehnderi]CFY08698.1 3-dehydroquinate synthase AroB [Syntrophomonas zehnderi OL-4]